jgi:hypothetical protein
MPRAAYGVRVPSVSGPCHASWTITDANRDTCTLHTTFVQDSNCIRASNARTRRDAVWDPDR